MTHLSSWETFVTAVMLSLGIIATRAVPFLLFSNKDKLPPWVLYLGGALPHASMAMLLVFCLKDIRLFHAPHGLPELLALLFTAGLHVWRNNVLLSIAGGTVCYMMLVQHVFTGGAA